MLLTVWTILFLPSAENRLYQLSCQTKTITGYYRFTHHDTTFETKPQTKYADNTLTKDIGLLRCKDEIAEARLKKGRCRTSPRAIHEHLAKSLKDFGDIPVDEKSPWLKNGDQQVNLCEYMWNYTSDTRNRALSTPFVQEMKVGMLDPIAFGGYMVQDSVYCQKAQKDLELASQKADGDLKQFLIEKAKSYKSYYESMFKEWHINDASGIGLGEACQKYVDILNDTAQNEEPIYLLVATIPCARLWPWIGQHITQGEQNFNCYKEWIEENFNPTYTSYLSYEARVNAAFQQCKLDWYKALQIYIKCMTGEADFFASAEEK